MNDGSREKRLEYYRQYNRTRRRQDNPLYQVWYSMLDRCENPEDPGYPRYGNRGVTVCEPWHDYQTFVADVLATIGPRPEGRYPNGRARWSLDRIDNSGPYEPGNLRWATVKMQAQNRRKPSGRPREISQAVRSTALALAEDGLTKEAIARQLGISSTSVHRFLKEAS